MSALLGVNIDHVATLRQQRDEDYPAVARACDEVLRAGADQITIHLREDRRHIQDADLRVVKNRTSFWKKTFNLELGMNPEIVKLAIDINPDWICLVPEKRAERTTEGGLNLLDVVSFKGIENTILLIKKNHPQIKVSLFVEADENILNRCLELPIDAVEIHTGEYARQFIRGQSTKMFLKDFETGFEKMSSQKIRYHAGHGLTDQSVMPLLNQGLFEEYNIGHWIVSEAVFSGLYSVVKKLKDQFNVTHDFRQRRTT